jgi:hypothetical protein
MKGNHTTVFRSAILAAAAALAACAAPVKKDDGAAVEARALERWNLLIAHKAEKAYDYLTPGFRQTVTREKYASDKNDVAVRWQAATAGGHRCEGDTCTVTVMVDSLVKMPGIGKPQNAKFPSEERWIRIDGTWYYLPDSRIKATPVVPGQADPADGAKKS